MNKLVTIGTTSWRAGDIPDANEVVYDGEFFYAADGFTALMVWDDGIGNVRFMSDIEIQMIPQQRQAELDAANPNMAVLRDAAPTDVQAINDFLAILVPTPDQILAEIRAIDRRMLTQLNAVNEAAIDITTPKVQV